MALSSVLPFCRLVFLPLSAAELRSETQWAAPRRSWGRPPRSATPTSEKVTDVTFTLTEPASCLDLTEPASCLDLIFFYPLSFSLVYLNLNKDFRGQRGAVAALRRAARRSVTSCFSLGSSGLVLGDRVSRGPLHIPTVCSHGAPARLQHAITPALPFPPYEGLMVEKLG